MSNLPSVPKTNTAKLRASNEVATRLSIDIIKESLEHPLVVLFSKSSSPNYPLSLAVAGGAFKYDETISGKTAIHAAVFSADRIQLSRALCLIGYVKGLKGTKYLSGGKFLPNAFNIEQVINCYLTSLACNDWRAHCHKVISDDQLEMPSLRWPQQRKATRYLIPCALVAVFGARQAVTENIFGVSVQDKLQAIGVKRGCDWCPNFKPNDFKIL